MIGASIETTLELWASSLRDVKGRIRPLFSQERVAASAGQFLDGLLGNEPRKTGWMRAEAAGDPGPWRQQAILGRGRWDADALRDIVRDYALETLADEDAVLVIDETGFLKQGKASCGVARQYTGSAGKITNCQIGVFAAYVSRHGHAFIDRALYLPKDWTDDPTRLKAAHVPDDVGFATKPQIARRMIARAIAAKVPFSCVAADSVYGTGEIETCCARRARAMCWALPPTTCSTPGARSSRSRDCRQDRADPSQERLAAPVGRRRNQRPTSARLGLSRTGRSRCRRIQQRAHRAMDARSADPPQHRRRRSGLLLHLVSQGHAHREAGLGRRPSLGDRGQLRDRQERTRSRSQRDPLLARLASARLARHARLRHDGRHPPSRQCRAAQKNAATPSDKTALLIRWSVQEIRRIAIKLAQRRIQPAHVIAWSLWRRAHQAEARARTSQTKNATVMLGRVLINAVLQKAR